jgi:large subunit ribosomal protein L22
MSRIGYSYQGENEGVARAMGRELRVSPKHAIEICNNLSGMGLGKAKSLLEDVIEVKRPIKFTRFNRGLGHRKGVGPGRYPKNASMAILKLLNEAEANAEYKGLGVDNLRIKHIAAQHARVVQGRFKGRAHNTPTTHVEVVLEEKK